MAIKKNIPGGEGERPIGAAKEQAKIIWDSVNSQSSWDVISSIDKLEIVRKFMKYALMRWFEVS